MMKSIHIYAPNVPNDILTVEGKKIETYVERGALIVEVDKEVVLIIAPGEWVHVRLGEE